MDWSKHLLIAGVVGATILASAGPPTAAKATATESHCVVAVTDQKPDGELIMGSPTCFDRLADALDYASRPTLSFDEAYLLSGSPQPLGSTFILGTHFDGYNGSGSSISVVGGSCTGGWWNTSSAWDNRISSSYNGCYRLRHYDYPNKAGDRYDTTGVGQTDNIYGGMKQPDRVRRLLRQLKPEACRRRWQDDGRGEGVHRR